MTLKEAFIFKAGNGISDTDAVTVLEFSNLDPDVTWDPEDATLKCKFYECLLSYLNQDNIGVASITEGGYGITYDKESKDNRLYYLALESGCQNLIDFYNPQPTVQNKSNIW